MILLKKEVHLAAFEGESSCKLVTTSLSKDPEEQKDIVTRLTFL